MGLIELRADAKLQCERIRSSKLPEGLKTELADNVWPFLEALLEENLGMDEAIGELIDQSENVLQPELAAAIVGALEMGKIICKEAEALLEQSDDDLRNKRVTDSIKQYRQAAEIVTDEVVASTVDIEAEYDEPGAQPAEPDEDAEAEPGEDDTPVEVPKPPPADDDEEPADEPADDDLDALVEEDADADTDEAAEA